MDRTFAEIYRGHDFVLSYELFPPKSDAAMGELKGNVQRLLEYTPNFITCTFGAGGSTRDRTLATLAEVQKLSDVPVASHLTCVNATADDLRDYLKSAQAQGIDNIVAIRGDAPEGQTEFTAVKGGFRYGNELVAFVRSEFPDFGVAAGGYPEVHPESTNADDDLGNLKRKVDSGADVVVTQLFYNNDDFFRFRDRCIAAGIEIPIVPGLLPVTSYAQIKRITSLCGAKLPDAFHAELERHAGDAEGQFEVGVQHATKQTAELIEGGVPGIHFYVLNKSRATASVLSTLHVVGR